LCAVPALRALRAALPQSHITLIGLPWAEEFARRYSHYLDGFLAFPGAEGLTEHQATPAESTRLIELARGRGFDLALQLHGSGRYTNPLVSAIGARRCAGFYRAGEPCPDPERFVAYPEDQPEIRRLLRLLDFLGIEDDGDAIDFPITDREWHVATELQIQFGLRPGEYVCVHTGSRLPSRRWGPDRFARVADALIERGLRVVLTGALAEAELTTSVQHIMRRDCINLAGQTSLGELAALLAGARLLVCNDTGVSHLAAALNVASVVIYNGSSPERWAPLDRVRHRRVFHRVECRPCAHWNCPVGHACAHGVTVDEVVREVEELL
jgi:ADP-heptose:LPS heptosyltransferase